MRTSKLAWGGGLALLVVLGATVGTGLLQQTSWPNVPMPPFEEELYLRIVADWSREGCVDVVTYTNLPDGTEVKISGAARGICPDGPDCMSTFVSADDRLLFLVRGPRNEVREALCRVARPHSRAKKGNSGILVRASVSSLSPSRRREQTERIGPEGIWLKGPQAARYGDSDGVSAAGYSNTVILEPRP